MQLATAIVLAVTAIANLSIAGADIARAPFVLANSAEVKVPEAWLPGLAFLKAAGGIGLLLWFAKVPVFPTAAAIGLVCFFIGAVTAHVRAGVIYNIAFPGAYLALAITSLTLLLLAHT
ncbi:MAG: DoxX family protein [Solirubrobacterales bacterium]|nr:DoxX family protein [Solirubrobacterales bacterium]